MVYLPPEISLVATSSKFIEFPIHQKKEKGCELHPTQLDNFKES